MKKIVIGCLGTTLVLGLAGILATWVLLIREQPQLESALAVAPMVTLDSTFSMVVSTSNAHPDKVVLDSIDIDDKFLEGFQVVSLDPEPESTMNIFGQRSWSFERAVAPGETLIVTYELRAVQEGHFSGDIDVCNPNQDFTTLLGDVVVRKTDAGNQEPASTP